MIVDQQYFDRIGMHERVVPPSLRIIPHPCRVYKSSNQCGLVALALLTPLLFYSLAVHTPDLGVTGSNPVGRASFSITYEVHLMVAGVNVEPV